MPFNRPVVEMGKESRNLEFGSNSSQNSLLFLYVPFPPFYEHSVNSYYAVYLLLKY